MESARWDTLSLALPLRGQKPTRPERGSQSLRLGPRNCPSGGSRSASPPASKGAEVSLVNPLVEREGIWEGSVAPASPFAAVWAAFLLEGISVSAASWVPF